MYNVLTSVAPTVKCGCHFGALKTLRHRRHYVTVSLCVSFFHFYFNICCCRGEMEALRTYFGVLSANIRLMADGGAREIFPPCAVLCSRFQRFFYGFVNYVRFVWSCNIRSFEEFRRFEYVRILII